MDGDSLSLLHLASATVAPRLGARISWRLAHMSGSWLGPQWCSQQEHLHVASPCGSGFLTVAAAGIQEWGSLSEIAMYLIQEENAWPFMIWPWNWWPRGSFKAAPKPHLNSRWGDRDSTLDGRWQGWGRAFRATDNCHLFEKIQFATTSLPLSISSL